ncbi:hypothetical protein ACQP2E_11000 [Actinoplanes sp. CA-015351]|uniref:hypothetical protein n=1 Tax=Actinoplanes sp. CA-015351 TaxID=3239897 RepID=UPI003D95FA23
MQHWQDVTAFFVPGYNRNPKQRTTRYRSSREDAARSLRREDQRLTRSSDNPG